MAKLFFTAYGGGHATMLALVAWQALQRGHQVIFLGLTTAKGLLAQRRIDSIGFADLWEFSAPGGEAYGRELAAQLPADGPVPLAESRAYLGISFAELVVSLGEDEARRRYAKQGRHAFLPVGFLQRVIRHYQPHVVVATNSPRAEQSAILAAGSLGVPSLCLVDLFALQEVRWISQPGYSDRICVLNERVREMFLQEGRKPSEVVVTGNPAFDCLNEPSAIAAGADMRRQRGWDDHRVTLLWASQVEPAFHPFNGALGDPELPRRIEAVLRQFIREHHGFRLIVRYHPSEREPFIPQEGVEHSPATELLPVLLHAVDVVVVTASTVGLEAAIAGRSVVTVDCSVFTADAPYSRMGVSIGVSRPEDLPSTLLQVAGSSLQPSTAAPRKLPPSAGATQRVMEVIESLLPDGV